jgi:dTDP-4-dehydrorhamnose 3,5-epimerase
MKPLKDQQTVTATGDPTIVLIDGVKVIRMVTHPDARGSITQAPGELFLQPIVDAHQVSIRPGRIKGWIAHHLQEDRLFFWQGDLRVVLYDDRTDSPTRGMINDLCFGESRPALCFIPPRVFHAVQNLGSSVASHMSFPTAPYDHANPDKYRLPIDTDLIPFDFSKAGW